MNELVIPIGLPGSGKSTYVDTNFKETHTILCLDDIRLAMGHVFKLGSEPYAKATLETIGTACMIRWVNIILYSTNVSKFITKRWIDKAHDYNYTVKLIVIMTPIKVCMKRQTKNVPEEKMKMFNDQLVQLILDIENLGADEIIRLEDGVKWDWRAGFKIL